MAYTKRKGWERFDIVREDETCSVYITEDGVRRPFLERLPCNLSVDAPFPNDWNLVTEDYVYFKDEKGTQFTFFTPFTFPFNPSLVLAGSTGNEHKITTRTGNPVTFECTMQEVIESVNRSNGTTYLNVTTEDPEFLRFLTIMDKSLAAAIKTHGTYPKVSMLYCNEKKQTTFGGIIENEHLSTRIYDEYNRYTWSPKFDKGWNCKVKFEIPYVVLREGAVPRIRVLVTGVSPIHD